MRVKFKGMCEEVSLVSLVSGKDLFYKVPLDAVMPRADSDAEIHSHPAPISFRGSERTFNKEAYG